MNQQFSASISGFCRTEDVFSAMNTIKSAGFDGVDMCLSVYSRRPGEALRQKDWWRRWANAVADYSAALSLPVVQAHAPWDQTIAPDFSYEPPEEQYARVFEACEIMSCKKLVFHPVLWFHGSVSPDLCARIETYNLRWFGELLPLAEKHGVFIEIENTFDYFHLQKNADGDFPYTSAEQLLGLVSALNHPLVKLCLDTGHANIAGRSPAEMILRYGGLLDTLHLNDNRGRTGTAGEDLHLFPGEGTLDWRGIKSALAQTAFSGFLNFEIISDLSVLSPSARIRRFALGLETFGRL